MVKHEMSLYLILHKVRGEPAFDIAERCDDMGTESDPGPWWIIPTSGHRAYPYRHWDLGDLGDISDINSYGSHNRPYYMDDLPPDWPDHYTNYNAPIAADATGLLATLGLLAPHEPLKRRI